MMVLNLLCLAQTPGALRGSSHRQSVLHFSATLEPEKYRHAWATPLSPRIDHPRLSTKGRKSKPSHAQSTLRVHAVNAGRAATMTHDYKGNSTTTVFPALNVRDGQVIAPCPQRHRHVE